MKKQIAMMFIVVLAGFALADSDYFDLRPVADGMVDSGYSATGIWNTRNIIRMGKTTANRIYRPWLKFDLSQIPVDMNIGSVQLILYGNKYATVPSFRIGTASRRFDLYNSKNVLLNEATTVWGAGAPNITNPDECTLLQSGCEATDSLGIIFSSILLADNLRQTAQGSDPNYVLVIDEPTAVSTGYLEMYMRENFMCQPVLRIYTKRFIDVPASLDGTLDSNNPDLTTPWNATNYYSLIGYNPTQTRTYKGWAKYDFSAVSLSVEDIESVSVIFPMIDLAAMNESIKLPLDAYQITNPEQLSNDLTCWNNPPLTGDIVAEGVKYGYGDFRWASYIMSSSEITDSIEAAISTNSEWGILLQGDGSQTFTQLQTLERGGSFVRIYLKD